MGFLMQIGQRRLMSQISASWMNILVSILTLFFLFFKFQGTQFLITASLKDCLSSYDSYILTLLLFSYKQTKSCVRLFLLSGLCFLILIFYIEGLVVFSFISLVYKEVVSFASCACGTFLLQSSP